MSPSPAPPQIITRFAPSPTGELHIGGARTALFAWAWARHHGDHGTFLLRFEDTDQKRSSKQSEQNILRDLDWLGLKSDNWNDIPRQSQRKDAGIYDTAIAQLADAGLAYEDDGAIRFKMDRDVSFTDAVYGDITVKASELEDFVIKKADGFPTFHLAVVVDDADMGVTHVIRGQEHLSNTAKHARLYDALGLDRPVWVHTPSIMNPDGSKMSKRDKAKMARLAAQTAGTHAPADIDPTAWSAFMAKDNDNPGVTRAIADQLGLNLPEIDVADFRASGYLPDVLLNYIALLGWNPGDDIERFDKASLGERFGFDRINKSNAKFDRDKLAAFNQDALAAMDPDHFSARLQKHVAVFHPVLSAALGDRLPTFAAMYQERSKTLDDPMALGAFFVTAPTDYQPKAVKKNLTKNDGEGLATLDAFRQVAASIDPWDAPTIQSAIETFTAQNQLKNMGSIAQPLRVALTGNAVSPPIDQTLALLGKPETLARIDACLKAIGSETA